MSFQYLQVYHKDVTVDPHCGPILFKLFTNDVGACLESNHLLFADDLKLYRVIKDKQDSLILQRDLDNLYRWSMCNGLHMNGSKCFVITFSKAHNYYQHIYDINSETLQRTTLIKDLGITLDHKLSFLPHINKITGQAFKQLGFIIRHGREFSPATLRLLYFTYVRSCLEYGSSIWSPHYLSHIECIERVQAKFLKSYAFRNGIYIAGISYEDRCALLNFSTLEFRRKCCDIMFLYKIVNNMVEAPRLLGLLNFNVPFSSYRTRSQNLFRCPFHRTNYGFHAPMSRIQRLYNGYCSVLDLSVSVTTFKRSLYSINAQYYYIYDTLRYFNFQSYCQINPNSQLLICKNGVTV